MSGEQDYLLQTPGRSISSDQSVKRIENEKFLVDKVNPLIEKLMIDLVIDKPKAITNYIIKWMYDFGYIIENDLEAETAKNPRSCESSPFANSPGKERVTITLNSNEILSKTTYNVDIAGIKTPESLKGIDQHETPRSKEQNSAGRYSIGKDNGSPKYRQYSRKESPSESSKRSKHEKDQNTPGSDGVPNSKKDVSDQFGENEEGRDSEENEEDEAVNRHNSDKKKQMNDNEPEENIIQENNQNRKIADIHSNSENSGANESPRTNEIRSSEDEPVTHIRSSSGDNECANNNAKDFNKRDFPEESIEGDLQDIHDDVDVDIEEFRKSKIKSKKTEIYMLESVETLSDEEQKSPEASGSMRRSPMMVPKTNYEIGSTQTYQRRENIMGEGFINIPTLEEFKPKTIKKKQGDSLRIREKLSRQFLFSEMTREQRVTIVDAMDITDYDEGDIVFKQGEEGDRLYIVEHGKLESNQIMKNAQNPLFIKNYETGNIFGEEALLHRKIRESNVIAVTPAKQYSVDRQTYNFVIKMGNLKKREIYRNHLKTIKILGGLTDLEREALVDCMYEQKFKAGDFVFSEGDSADKLYIVTRGHCTGVKEIDGVKRHVNNYKANDYFGEIALIKNFKRPTSIIVEVVFF